MEDLICFIQVEPIKHVYGDELYGFMMVSAGLLGFLRHVVFMFGLYMWASEAFMASVCVHNQNED